MQGESTITYRMCDYLLGGDFLYSYILPGSGCIVTVSYGV
jgi:hypothetical protein